MSLLATVFPPPFFWLLGALIWVNWWWLWTWWLSSERVVKVMTRMLLWPSHQLACQTSLIKAGWYTGQCNPSGDILPKWDYWAGCGGRGRGRVVGKFTLTRKWPRGRRPTPWWLPGKSQGSGWRDFGFAFSVWEGKMKGKEETRAPIKVIMIPMVQCIPFHYLCILLFVCTTICK